jgi:DNA-nicking Smr family endonuclease
VPKKRFNNPFERVKLDRTKREEAKPAPPASPPAAPTKAAPERGTLNDEELWALAVEGAAPLNDRSGRVKPGPEPIALAAEPLDPELAAYDELRALVTGAAPFDIADTDEFIEGATRGLDRHVLRRLRRGEFAVQGHVDLHGLTRDEARSTLESFLQRSRQAGKRCVLVVHGRGLHSKDQMPVLKEALKRWMSTARFADHVLAFATARPHDGGLGAVYVLLRRL